MKIIALAGPHGAGKSEVAKALVKLNPGALLFPFANGLKITARDLGWNGEKDAKGIKFLEDLTLAREEYDPGGWAREWEAHWGPNVFLVADDLRLASFLPMLARHESYTFALWRRECYFGESPLECLAADVSHALPFFDNNAAHEDCAAAIMAAVKRGEGRVVG